MRQEELRLQNRQRVLLEALKCFYEEGIERTKVSTIAQRANVTSMSVYRYFGDKENIVLETSKLFWRRLGEALNADWDAPSGVNGLGLATANIDRYIKVYQFRPQALLLMQDFNLYLSKRKYFEKRGVSDQERRLASEPLRAAIALGQSDGSIRADIDADLAADTIYNMLIGVLLRAAACGQSDDEEHNAPIRMLIDMATGYLRK